MKRKADNSEFGPPGGGRGGRGRGPPRYGPGPGFGGPIGGPPPRVMDAELMHGPPGRAMMPPPAGPVPAPAALAPLPDEPIMLQEVLLGKRLAGVLIGTGGSNVSLVRRESKCKVHVSEVRGPEQVQAVELTGTEKQIGLAVAAMRRILTDFDSEHKIDIKPTVDATVEIYPEMVGSVLGKAGATIKVIRQKSGAQVRVEDLQPGERMQLVLISGTIEQVKLAYAEVKGIIDRFDPSKVKGGFPPPLLPPGPNRGMIPLGPGGPGGRYGPPDDRYGPPVPPDPRGRGPPPDWYDDGYDYPASPDGPHYGPMGRMDGPRPGPRGAGPYGPMRGSPPPGAGGRFGPDGGPGIPPRGGYGGPEVNPDGYRAPYGGGPGPDPRLGPASGNGVNAQQQAQQALPQQPQAAAYQPAPQQAQQPQYVQVAQPQQAMQQPASAQHQVGPVVLMLQPDGTYKPAQVVLYNVAPGNQGAQVTSMGAPLPQQVTQVGMQAAQQPQIATSMSAGGQVVYSTNGGAVYTTGNMTQMPASVTTYPQAAQVDGHGVAVAAPTAANPSAATAANTAVATTAAAANTVSYGMYGAQQQQPQAQQQQVQTQQTQQQQTQAQQTQAAQQQTQTAAQQQAQPATVAAQTAYGVYGQTYNTGAVGVPASAYGMTQEQMHAYMRGQYVVASQQQQQQAAAVHQAYANPYAAYPYTQVYSQAQAQAQVQQTAAAQTKAADGAASGAAVQQGGQPQVKTDQPQQAQAGAQQATQQQPYQYHYSSAS